VLNEIRRHHYFFGVSVLVSIYPISHSDEINWVKRCMYVHYIHHLTKEAIDRRKAVVYRGVWYLLLLLYLFV
jgi:hypothetical protein